MISTSLIYSAIHLPIVGAFESLPRENMDPDFWSDPSTTSLKSFLKAHYIAAQKNRCCYCDRFFATNNHRMWDIEHIVPRSSHPQFMFTAENLAVACPDCNTEKGKFQTLFNPRLVGYPKTSGHFKVLHPHHDKYEEHIYRNGFVYVPRTSKGTVTITACNLLRYAQEYIDWSSVITDTRFNDEVDALFAQGDPSSALARIVSQLPPRA